MAEQDGIVVGIMHNYAMGMTHRYAMPGPVSGDDGGDGAGDDDIDPVLRPYAEL